MAEYKEQFLQEQFAHWLDSKSILFNASMAGVNLGIRTAVRRKKMGCKKGFPDIFIYRKSGDKKHNGLAIELKAGQRPTPEQYEWQKALQYNGYISVIMPSNLSFQEAFDYLRNTVEDYLK